MKTKYVLTLMLGLFISLAAYSQDQTEMRKKMQKEMMQKENPMKTYVIEREIPDAGKLTGEQLKGISQKSCSVLKEMGSGIEWLHSYVTDDKVFCVYKAENKELLVEHAKRGGFPVNSIQELATKIGPETANE
ncbi:DUF4242 domain-containing protein [Allomuricauda sp. d1]|uniref:DUF4242 domain-containing protein n=1 Tax=Allomuricauda sp. d1 TaxID=3136725 RepID=UPI0031DBFA61